MNKLKSARFRRFLNRALEFLDLNLIVKLFNTFESNNSFINDIFDISFSTSLRSFYWFLNVYLLIVSGRELDFLLIIFKTFA